MKPDRSARDSSCWTRVLGIFFLFSGCVDAFLGGVPGGRIPRRPPSECHGVHYFPDRQSCCGGKVYSIPESTHAQCCDGVAYWRNGTKPDSCTVAGCGSGRWHPDTEICCNSRAVWVGPHSQSKICCGKTVMDKETHACCGRFPIKQGSGYSCCGFGDWNDAKPYHRDTMSCSDTSYDVILNTRQHFRSSDVCDRSLPEWDTSRPLPKVVDDLHVHVRGWVEKCTIKVKNQTSGWKIFLALTPFFSRSELDYRCPDMQTLHLTVQVKRGQTCRVNREQLQDYFHGKTLDIFFRKGMKCRGGALSLRLKDGYNAVMYVSRYHSNDILVQVLP